MRAEFAAALQDTQTEFGSGFYDDFQRCARSHALAQVIELRTPSHSKAFDIGKLCHAVLRYAGSAEVHSQDWSDWPDLLEYAAQQPEWSAADCDEAANLMQHYFLRWGTPNAGYPAGFAIKQVEQEWRAEFGGLEVTARADTLLCSEDEIYIVDHKTRASKLPQNAEEIFRLRPQFMRLCALWRKLHPQKPRAAVWVNALIKTKTPDFARQLVRISDVQLDAWEENQVRLARLIASAPAMRLPANFGECYPQGHSSYPCWAKDYCWGSEAMRERKYKQKGS